MFRIIFFISFLSFAQTNKLKSWADKDDFVTSEIELSNNQHEPLENSWSKVKIEDLKAKYLKKKIRPISISKEFREYYYQNFFKDKKFRKKIKNKDKKGFRQHSKNGSFGTLVFYKSNSNYSLLKNQIFIVEEIYSISQVTSLEKTDDTNFMFKLFNSELGLIYYKYNTKFIDKVEIELVN